MPDLPCPEIPQALDDSDFTSLDHDILFGQPVLATPVSDRSENVTFNGLGNFPDDSIASTRCMLPVTCCAETMGARALGHEPNNAPFLPMSDDELRMQDILFDFNHGNVQKAPSSPEVKPSNPGSDSQLPPERATETPFQFEITSNIASPVFSLAPMPIAPPVAFDWTVATPIDEHYSNASSSRKRPKIKELQHVSSEFPLPFIHAIDTVIRTTNFNIKTKKAQLSVP